MARNPRGKAEAKPTDDNQEDAVSDQTTEAPEASNTETAEAAPTETAAPAAPKITAEQHEANLFGAITAFATDSDVAKLQAAYREVPTAARGKVQGIAMKRAMQDGGVDMEVLSAVLDAFNNLPAATKSRTAKPALDEPTAKAIRLSGLMVAYDAVRAEVGEEAHEQALLWYKDGAPSEHESAILKVANSVSVASAKGRSGGGTRSGFTEKLVDLVNRGDVPAGSTLKGAGGAEATVNADGTVTTKGESFDNLSKAARTWRTKEDGKQTSTNGWDFWSLGDVTVGSLRKA